MEPYTKECCISEVVKVSDVEAQYEQRKRKLNEILNSDDTEIDENKFSDSLIDVVKKTINNAYSEYIRICRHTGDDNENPVHQNTIKCSSSNDLDKSIIEAADRINPKLGDIISKIPKIEDIEKDYMNAKYETIDNYYSSLNNKKRTRVLKNHKAQFDESTTREESQSTLVDENEMIFTVEMYYTYNMNINSFRQFTPYPLCICNFLSSMNLSYIKDIIEYM